MRAGGRLRVLIVDDHRMFAEGLTMLLGSDPDIEVVGSVGRGEDALEVAGREHLDVALVDIDLPGIGGIETTTRLREIDPDLQVVVITAFQEAAVVAQAVEAGACGFVPKTKAADELADVIRRAARGELILPEAEMRAVLGLLEQAHHSRSVAVQRVAQLTTREVETLELIAEGLTTAEVANRLFISPSTVQSHVKSIMAKLGVHSKLAAVIFAARQGLIDLSSR